MFQPISKVRLMFHSRKCFRDESKGREATSPILIQSCVTESRVVSSDVQAANTNVAYNSRKVVSRLYINLYCSVLFYE